MLRSKRAFFRRARKSGSRENTAVSQRRRFSVRSPSRALLYVLFRSAGYPLAFSYYTWSLFFPAALDIAPNTRTSYGACGTCVVRARVTCNIIYRIYICLCYVYRSELKLRSVRTAIYGASLLCVALRVLCRTEEEAAVVPVNGRGMGFLWSRWWRGRGGGGVEGGDTSVVAERGIPDGERTPKVAPFATSIAPR